MDMLSRRAVGDYTDAAAEASAPASISDLIERLTGLARRQYRVFLIGPAIAIARALTTNPRILIFDEATSALDYESERLIQQNMRQITAGRTVLIIAHRLSTVRMADRIITIERGRLIEDGSHEQLIGTGGRYATLHRVQAGIHDVH